MAKRKAKDAHGVVVEMLQHGGAILHAAVTELFNDILGPVAGPLE